MSLLTQPVIVYAEPSGSRSGGGDIPVFDRALPVVVKPATGTAAVADDVVVDGRIITAENGVTTPAGPHAFDGRLLTAADLRADQ